ncbi:hypothetical protein GPL21_33065 [Bradyrhizobium pachyrhizi]|uniref:DUF3828 domain-containing protein n=1 Tax=Bradyrhizobium pachyrhizi TaxID=280333 RepID=A0A844T5J5_9BRAD|nr:MULTISPECIES: hypothetical protein [Bradyrhizobium]MVT69920.1 hypothetical protein [Bradyrhizobium pachyrhizi]WFU53117.1 hypothetical protein QA639_25975 [Bradyrhizobium pachyrhizi]WOH78889.1 hypothetical protein RX327_23565 [Bradyrhizobium sp. BEA-2-5]
MGRGKFLAGFSLVAAVFAAATACAGFRSPESLIRNVYAYYGRGSAEYSNGLPRDEETARRFFDPTLRGAWTALHDAPYDFLVQSPTWRLGPISIAIPRRQFDRTDVTVTFDNEGRAVTLNFIVVNGPDGWVISDVESPHDSLRMFLTQFRR